jgi:hypothetical protein
MGDCSLWALFKIMEVHRRRHNWATFSGGKSYVLVLNKNRLGNLLGDVFTYASGRPDCLTVFIGKSAKKLFLTNTPSCKHVRSDRTKASLELGDQGFDLLFTCLLAFLSIKKNTFPVEIFCANKNRKILPNASDIGGCV